MLWCKQHSFSPCAVMFKYTGAANATRGVGNLVLDLIVSVKICKSGLVLAVDFHQKAQRTRLQPACCVSF